MDKIVTVYVFLSIASSKARIADNSKDYMALTVVPEDQPASTQMELKAPEDQKTKVNHFMSPPVHFHFRKTESEV